MDSKISKLSTEEQLLQARERGLREANEVNAMSAHGKVLGMDTFSWVSPQLDILSTVLSSFPFPVLWVGSHDQIKNCLENYPEIIQKIDTVILYDRTLLNTERTILKDIKNITCIEGTDHALTIAKSMSKKKRVFLFTIDKKSAHGQREQFEQFITSLR
jgi:hypothetical protein